MAENELYQRRTVRSERVPACETGSKIAPAILTLGFVYDLSRSLSVNPNVYYTDGNLMIAVMFSGSSFGCDDFMEGVQGHNGGHIRQMAPDGLRETSRDLKLGSSVRAVRAKRWCRTRSAFPDATSRTSRISV